MKTKSQDSPEKITKKRRLDYKGRDLDVPVDWDRHHEYASAQKTAEVKRLGLPFVLFPRRDDSGRHCRGPDQKLLYEPQQGWLRANQTTKAEEGQFYYRPPETAEREEFAFSPDIVKAAELRAKVEQEKLEERANRGIQDEELPWWQK